MDSWEITEDTAFDLDGPVDLARLRLVDGAIDVVSTDGAARVEIRDVSGPPVTVTLDRGELVIKQKPKGLFLTFGKVRATVSIAVPGTARADVDSVSADLTVAGIGGPVSVNTVSGAVVLDDLPGGVNAKSVSGSIELRRVGGVVTLHAMSGDVTVMSGGVDAFTLKTVSGDATLDLMPAPGSRLQAESVSGDVLMRTPLDAYETMDLASVSGKLRTEGHTSFDVRRGPGSNRASFSDGTGSARFSGRTVSGTITLIDHL